MNLEVGIVIVVDVNGVPQDACLSKSAGYGLDAQAANAARQYRFTPANKDGKPVPKRIVVRVSFVMY
ncbi:MAG: TonB family protein [Terracidiphilus sp.]